MFGVRSRRSTARRAVLAPIAAVAMIAGAGLVAAASAPGTALAATPTTLSFGTGGVKVTTHNGVKWLMAVGSVQLFAGEAPSATVILEREIKVHGATDVEEHAWLFQLTNGSVAFNSSTGAGTLNAGTEASPVAKIDLHFTATSHKSATCTSGKETVYSGKVTGELVLDTGFKKGGTVGGTNLSFSVGASQVSVDSECEVSSDTCIGGTIFSSGNVKGTFAAGANESLFGGKNVDLLDVARAKTLRSPKGAFREDIVAAVGPSPTYNASSKVLTITTASSGPVRGSATLSGGKVKSVSYPCSYKGKKYTIKVLEDLKAHWASPAGDLITGKSALLGKMTVPASEKNGFYEIATAEAG